MKKLLLLAPVAVAALGVGELYRYTFCREGSKLLAPFLDSKGHEDAYYPRRDAAAFRLRRTPSEPMELRSARGERLRGWYYPLGGKGRRIAFLVHGYRSEHAEAAGMYLDYYASRGFDLFCCDHTAHGESGGRFIGFDVLERADCLRWVDALIDRFGADVEIVLHGFSMGSSTVLQMSGDCPEQVRLIVADCGFISAEEQLCGSFGRFYPVMAMLHRVIAGVDLRQSDVRPSLARSTKPILFVHGREDPTVPFSNGERLFEFYQGPKDALFVDGARHVESIHVDPEGYARKLDTMIERYFA